MTKNREGRRCNLAVVAGLRSRQFIWNAACNDPDRLRESNLNYKSPGEYCIKTGWKRREYWGTDLDLPQSYYSRLRRRPFIWTKQIRAANKSPASRSRHRGKARAGAFIKLTASKSTPIETRRPSSSTYALSNTFCQVLTNWTRVADWFSNRPSYESTTTTSSNTF